MALLNLLLDLVALVLLLTGLGVGNRMPAHRAGTLLSNLKLAASGPKRRWPLFAGLAALLALRPFVYAPLAEVSGWVPEWNPLPASVPFRADFLSRLLAFSMVSFVWTVLQFLSWMLFASALARGTRDPSAWNRFFNDLLGPMSRLPTFVILLVPPAAAGMVWIAVSAPLQWMRVLPALNSWQHLVFQSLMIGAGIWVFAGWMLSGLLLLRLVNTYVYLGTHPFWDFVHQVGGTLVRPLEWLPVRIGKLDLTALAAALLLGIATWGAEFGLRELYLRVPP